MTEKEQNSKERQATSKNEVNFNLSLDHGIKSFALFYRFTTMSTSRSSQAQRVAIIGASDKPDRYSYKAMKALQQAGHEVILIHPSLKNIEGLAVIPELNDIDGEIDTLTMYVRPEISGPMSDELLRLKPKRVIFNPMTENPRLEDLLDQAQIPYLRACTLVLLATDQF